MVRDLGISLRAPAISAIGGVIPRGAVPPMRGQLVREYLLNRRISQLDVLASLGDEDFRLMGLTKMLFAISYVKHCNPSFIPWERNRCLR